MKLKIAIALLFSLFPLIGCADLFSPQSPVAIETKSVETRNLVETRYERSLQEGFEQRSLAIREKLAARDLEELDAWWREINLGDPHKYLLPVILSRLTIATG